jgi:hypothetical protein
MAEIPGEAELLAGIYKLIRQYTVGHQRAEKGAEEILAFVRPLIEKRAREEVVKWSETLCPHSWGKYPNLGSKKGCQRCWEDLVASQAQGMGTMKDKTQEAEMIVYKELPLMFGGAKEARYKGVLASISIEDNWVSIITIESSNRRRGEVNEFITLLKQEYPGKELWSSVPLNSIWDYIAHKNGIKHLEASNG